MPWRSSLRLTRPQQDDVVVKKLYTIELGLYASREYAASYGLPKDGELAGHRVIAFADTRAFRRENEWLDEQTQGATIVLRSDSVSSLVSAAIAGAGVAMLPCKVADVEPDLLRIAHPGSPEPRHLVVLKKISPPAPIDPRRPGVAAKAPLK